MEFVLLVSWCAVPCLCAVRQPIGPAKSLDFANKAELVLTKK